MTLLRHSVLAPFVWCLTGVGSTPIATIAGSAGKHPELTLKPALK